MKKIIRYVFTDLLRNKSIIVYTLLLFALSVSVYSMEDHYEKGIISLLNIVLFVIPLMNVVFTCIYLYNSVEFINLLVSQPIRRKVIWLSLYFGIASVLSLSFVIGVALPTMIYAYSSSGIMLILCGVLLSIIFIGIAMCIAVWVRDKSKGIGLSILLWLYFGLLFDALVLFLLFQFSDYPIENFMVAISMFNPIDISRIMILLELDISAMMGYTGAIFRDFFGTYFGISITISVMLFWAVVPVWLSIKHFKKKDL